MDRVGARIRERLAELAMTQADLARATGLSTARIGNYVQGTRPPDIATLAKLARALQTSTDWLLGLSESRPLDVRAVVFRLLQLDGMPEARASLLAEVASKAVQLLAALPGEGDNRTRAHLAAQAAWQTKSLSTQH